MKGKPLAPHEACPALRPQAEESQMLRVAAYRLRDHLVEHVEPGESKVGLQIEVKSDSHPRGFPEAWLR